jgi:hypothetical protein
MHRSKEQAGDYRSFWVDAFWLKGDRESYINFKARQSERRAALAAGASGRKLVPYPAAHPASLHAARTQSPNTGLA